jgi:HKD family nuclease
LAKELKGAMGIDVLVAYAKQSGFDALRKFLESGPAIDSRLLIGLGFGRTDPSVLRDLLALTKDSKLKIRVFLGGNLTPEQFHPKLYVVNKGSTITIIVGSSNLTSGGLENNVEANFSVSDKRESDIARQISSFVNTIWNDPNSVPLTKDIVDDYQKAVEITRNEQDKIKKEFRGLRRRLAVRHGTKVAALDDVIEEIKSEAHDRGLTFDGAPDELPRSRNSFKITGLKEPVYGVLHRSNERIKYPNQIWVGVLASSWRFLEGKRSFVVVVDVLGNHTFFVPLSRIRPTSTGYGSVRAFRIKKSNGGFSIYENRRDISDCVDKMDIMFQQT